MPSVIHVMTSVMAAALGVLFNGYILFVFIWNRRIRTANRLLLFHLAFVDVVFSLIILFYNTSLSAVFSVSFPTATYELLPKSTHVNLADQQPSSRQLCQAQGFLWSLLPMVVVWNVCGLSCDRYAAISIPLHYSRLMNARRAGYFVAAAWVLGIMLALPPLVGVCSHAFWDARWGCAADCVYSGNRYAPYAFAHVFISVLLPLMVILFCNLHMVVISRFHRHRIATAICDMTVNAQATITHQRSPCHLSKFRGRNAVFTITQIVGSLLVFTLPYYGVFIWETAKGEDSHPVLVSATTFLLTCTPSVNAYVYGVKSRMLRQTVKRLLQQHLHKRDPNKNMKRRLSEIFSDNNPKQPPSRRMSAPADYCRRMQSKMNSEQQSACPVPLSQPAKAERNRPPFARSISLPINGSPDQETQWHSSRPLDNDGVPCPPANSQRHEADQPQDSQKNDSNVGEPQHQEVNGQRDCTESDTHLPHGCSSPESNSGPCVRHLKCRRPPLRKSESAPESEDVLHCEIVYHLPPTGLTRRKDVQRKREKFVRSCSYPTHSPTYHTRRKLLYSKKTTRPNIENFLEEIHVEAQ